MKRRRRHCLVRASQEAVALFRVWAADNPAAHQEDLAATLNNFAAAFSCVGRHQDALGHRSRSRRSIPHFAR
jgi:hypothetical protein